MKIFVETVVGVFAIALVSWTIWYFTIKSLLDHKSPKQEKAMKKALSEKGQIQIVLIIVAVFLCGVGAAVWSWAESRMPASTTYGGVQMIQPQGASPEKDFANSQSNLYNSQANHYNAQATAVIIDAQGGFIVNAAQATQIVADSNQGPVNTYLQGQLAGQKNAGNLLLFGIGGLAVGALALFSLVGNKSKP